PVRHLHGVLVLRREGHAAQDGEQYGQEHLQKWCKCCHDISPLRLASPVGQRQRSVRGCSHTRLSPSMSGPLMTSSKIHWPNGGRAEVAFVTSGRAVVSVRDPRTG